MTIRRSVSPLHKDVWACVCRPRRRQPAPRTALAGACSLSLHLRPLNAARTAYGAGACTCKPHRRRDFNTGFAQQQKAQLQRRWGMRVFRRA